MYRPEGPVELRPVGEVEFVQGLAAAAATGLWCPRACAYRRASLKGLDSQPRNKRTMHWSRGGLTFTM
jgi:hypothetical protein